MDIEKSNKKILILIAFIVFMVLLYYAYGVLSMPRKEHLVQQLPSQKTETDRLTRNTTEVKEFEKQDTDNANNISILESETEAEIENETAILDSVDTTSHFSEQVPLLAEKRRENIKTYITRDELPVELQQELDRTMEYYDQNGYLDIDESYIEYLDAPYNAVVEFDLKDPSLMFVAENLDDTALVDMEYVGIIPDRDMDEPGAPVPEIRRVFKHEAGYLYLSEAGMNESNALLQKEFVNKSVKGYPATQMTYCSSSERCVTTLTWLTANKRYELSLRGDIKALGEDKLESIAGTLKLPPIPEKKTEN